MLAILLIVRTRKLCRLMQKSMPGPEIRKPGRQDTHLWPSKEMPPAGTIMWTCGWWVSADPQVCITVGHKVTAVESSATRHEAVMILIQSQPRSR